MTIEPVRWNGGNPDRYHIVELALGILGTRDTATNKVLPCVKVGRELDGTPQGGTMEPITTGLALGLNVLNLGLSIYKAYQLRKTRTELAGLSSFLQSPAAPPHRSDGPSVLQRTTDGIWPGRARMRPLSTSTQ